METAFAAPASFAAALNQLHEAAAAQAGTSDFGNDDYGWGPVPGWSAFGWGGSKGDHTHESGPGVRTASLLEQRGFEPPVLFGLFPPLGTSRSPAVFGRIISQCREILRAARAAPRR
jgi:hypothetical protein